MNIVKELRKLLRFRVLIVRWWVGGGSYKSNSTISSNSSVQQCGGKVCVSGKNSRTSSISAVTGGGGGEGMGTVIIHIEIYKYNRTAQRNTFKTVGASYHPHRSSMWIGPVIIHTAKIFPGSRRFASLFSRAEQQPLFFVALREPFFHRPLHCRFFRGFAPQTHLWLPHFWNSWRFMPKFPPEPAQPLFWGRFAPNFFPRRYTVVFFMTLPAPNTPQFDPLRGLAALLPQFLRSWIRFFPARCTAVFLPRTKSC